MAGTPALFEPLRLGGITLANRIAVSPMCQYGAMCPAEAQNLVHQVLERVEISGSVVGIRAGKLAAVEVLNRRHPNDVWIVALIAIHLGRNHQHFMPPPAIFLLECHNAARYTAHHWRVRVGQHQDSHD